MSQYWVLNSVLLDKITLLDRLTLLAGGLSSNYQSFCDPRLNYTQSLEMAMQVSLRTTICNTVLIESRVIAVVVVVLNDITMLTVLTMQ